MSFTATVESVVPRNAARAIPAFISIFRTSFDTVRSFIVDADKGPVKGTDYFTIN